MAGRKKSENHDPNAPKAPPLSKRGRFEKHAARRVGAVLKALKRCRNMANRSGWEYTDVECEKMCSAIINAVNGTVKALRGVEESDGHFSF